MTGPESICTHCIQPCETQDGECTGPITEEEQKAVNGAIIFEQQQKENERLIAENNLELDA